MRVPSRLHPERGKRRMDIQAKAAGVEELSVTVKALRVNGRQMTAAVFRQLAEKNPYLWNNQSQSFDLLPVKFWGFVLYEFHHIHEWLVFEYKGCLYKTDYRDAPRDEAPQLDQLFIAV